MNSQNHIAVSWLGIDQKKAAESLAAELSLPLVEAASEAYGFFLVRTEQRLELRRCGGNEGPVFVDFVSGKAEYRRQHGGGTRQNLARALGIKGRSTFQVIDATAGLGQDAFVIACLGCRVLMFERNPVIAALLEDGLRRGAEAPDIAEIVSERLRLVKTGFETLPREHFPETAAVYLDPMFPHRTKSGLVKKEMRILREITGDDLDAPELLAKALTLATVRVVVKRPKGAPAVEGPQPSFVVPGKSGRFDVYLVKKP